MKRIDHTDEEVRKLFTALDRFAKEKVQLGLLGGVAVMQYGVVRRTKDIDVCFFDGFQLEKVRDFLDRYMRRNDIIIDYGLPGRFVSGILGEELFAHPAQIPSLRESFLSKHRFQRLDVKMIIPKYLILVKLEAAMTRSTHYMDAREVARFTQVPLEELVAAYQEHRVELEKTRDYREEFEVFVRDAYDKPRWRLPQP